LGIRNVKIPLVKATIAGINPPICSGISDTLMPNDAYFYGVLPILSETAVAYGVDKVEIARASMMMSAKAVMTITARTAHFIANFWCSSMVTPASPTCCPFYPRPPWRTV
jgi:Mg2+/citrate symporter